MCFHGIAIDHIKKSETNTNPTQFVIFSSFERFKIFILKDNFALKLKKCKRKRGSNLSINVPKDQNSLRNLLTMNNSLPLILIA